METKVNPYELKAIQAMEKIFGNKYTLQAENPQPHNAGLLYEFELSNGEIYLVKVYGDSSSTMIFKQIS